MNRYPWLLLHPNIPKPLHGLAPRVIKGEKWFNQTKREAKAKLNQHCWACGVHKYDAKYHHWHALREGKSQKLKVKNMVFNAHKSYNIGINFVGNS